MLGHLMPQGGGDPIPLMKSKLLIGRRDSCDISLRFPNVSSEHCELEFQNGYWLVRDLNSANGTKVNGIRVDEKFALPGDELSVAKHRFKFDYEPLSEAPPPQADVLSQSLLDRAEEIGRQETGPMPSLLEKAGLAGRKSDRRLTPSPPKSKSDKAEDEAMKWLAEE